MPLDRRDLLEKERLPPSKVMVMGQRPWEAELRRILPWLAAERPDVLNAYRQTHGPEAEKALMRADFPHPSSRKRARERFSWACIAGRDRNLSESNSFGPCRLMKELKAFLTLEEPKTRTWFDLEPMQVFSEWKGAARGSMAN